MNKFIKRFIAALKAVFGRFRKNKDESVDYIVALPTPLSPDEEREMIALNENGDMCARNTLIEHNLRLVVYIAKRFDQYGHRYGGAYIGRHTWAYKGGKKATIRTKN